MKRSLLLPALTSLSIAAVAQPGPLKTLPTWKAGELRQVDTGRIIRFTLDSVRHEVKVDASYRLEVVRVGKYGMELEIRTLRTDALEAQSRLKALLGGSGTGARQEAMDRALQDLYAKLNGLPVRFEVALDGTVGGQVDAVRTVEKLRPVMTKLLPGLMEDVARRQGTEAGPLSASRIDFLTDSILGAMIFPQLLEINRFMRTYGLTFPLSGSQRQAVVHRQLLAPWGQVYAELPATVDAGLDRQDAKQATMRRVVVRPAATWVPAMADAAFAQGADTAACTWAEEAVEEFDRAKAWPLSSTSDTNFRCGKLRMHITDRATVKKVD